MTEQPQAPPPLLGTCDRSNMPHPHSGYVMGTGVAHEGFCFGWVPVLPSVVRAPEPQAPGLTDADWLSKWECRESTCPNHGRRHMHMTSVKPVTYFDESPWASEVGKCDPADSPAIAPAPSADVCHPVLTPGEPVTNVVVDASAPSSGGIRGAIKEAVSILEGVYKSLSKSQAGYLFTIGKSLFLLEAAAEDAEKLERDLEQARTDRDLLLARLALLEDTP